MKRRLFAPAALAGVLLVASACGDDDDSTLVENVGSQDPTVDEGQSGDTETQDAEAQDGEAQDTEVETSSPASDGTPLATTSADLERGVNREGRVPITLDVTRLERNGDLVNLEVTLTNEDDSEDFSPYSTTFSDDPGNSFSDVKLVDQENGQVYMPAVDSEGSCLCSDITLGFDVEAGDSVQLHATFGGLPEDVTEVDVDVTEFSALTNVPIQG